MDKFEGMTDSRSIEYQLEQWVDGNPLHNTVRDECCPDFSCCNDGKMMPLEVRERFVRAVKDNDDGAKMSILGMGLSMAFENENVHVVDGYSEEV